MSELALPNSGSVELPHGERLLSDELLARLVGRGSARSFATLYERHHQAIYRYCRSILRDEHDAQDALQSAMTRAYAALRMRERDLAVKPWLFRIAHNESISLLRKRRHELELSDARDRAGPEIDGALELRERMSTLLADIRELPERQRGALVMRELSGLSIEEIAGALAISPGGAKQALFEARSSLQDLQEGRDMRCEDVRQAISARDGRVLRGRKIRAHTRACEGCRDFRAAIGEREAGLRALAPPLPVPAAGAILARSLAGGSTHGGGGAAIGSSTAAVGGGSAAAGGSSSLTGHAASSMIAKGLAGVAMMAAATAGTVRLENHGSAHTRADRASPVATHRHPSAAGRGLPTVTGAAPTAIARAHAHTRTQGGAGGTLTLHGTVGGSPTLPASAGALSQALAARGAQSRGRSRSAEAPGKRTGNRTRAKGKQGQPPRNPQAQGRAHEAQPTNHRTPPARAAPSGGTSGKRGGPPAKTTAPSPAGTSSTARPQTAQPTH
jgi:RNA polymerase sigma factor (sigma-70 family)